MKKVLSAVGAFGLLLLATLAVAQPVTQNAVSGNECWNAGQGPGGPSQFLCINTVRNGTAFNLFSGSGGVTTTATQANSTMMWTGAAPTTWTITLPNPAFDGEVISVSTDTTLTTMVTVQAASSPQNQTLNATFNSQTITAVTSVEFQYNASGAKWYRLR